VTGGTVTTSTLVGGATAGQFKATNGVAGTVIITLGGQTASNGWSCWVNDLTTANIWRQSATTTTTVTLSGTSVTNDIFTFGCVGY
jgi:trans-2-enoyl-CoA reductase